MAGARIDELRRVFGTHVRQCRKARGWTQGQLAEKAGLSLDMIGRLERGQASPSLDTIAGLSKEFAVSPAVLLGGSPLSKESNTEREDILRAIMTLLVSTDDQELRRVKDVLEALLRR